MSFGQRLSIVRKKRNMTQKEIGKHVGMVPDLVSRYERDAIVPSIETAAKFAKALDISLDYLVLGHEPPEATTPAGINQKLQQVETLPDADRAHVFAVIDAFLIKQRINALMG